MKPFKTIEAARKFVLEVKVCTLFGSDKCPHPALWDHVDLPAEKPARGWSQRVGAVWTWKNELPARWPEDIYYGKIKGGFAVLMALDYLRDVHFKEAYKPISEHTHLEQVIHEKVRVEPWETGPLRKAVLSEVNATKSRFDTALKNLQISLNVVRSNDPEIESDTWLRFKELYPDIWAGHMDT